LIEALCGAPRSGPWIVELEAAGQRDVVRALARKVDAILPVVAGAEEIEVTVADHRRDLEKMTAERAPPLQVVDAVEDLVEERRATRRLPAREKREAHRLDIAGAGPGRPEDIGLTRVGDGAAR